MKKLILKLTIILLITTTMLVTFELFSRRLYSSVNDYAFKIGSLKKKSDTIEIIFLGNSHPEQAINPQFIQKKSFNLAYVSQDLYYDFKVFKTLLPQLHSLKEVWISLDFYSFGYDEFEVDNSYAKEYFNTLNILPRNGISLPLLLNQSIFWQYRDRFYFDLFSKHEANTRRILAENAVTQPELYSNTILQTGFRHISRGSTVEELIESSKWISHLREKEYYNYRYISQAEKYLDSLILLADTKNIRINLYTPPFDSTYNNRFNTDIKHSFYEILNTFLKKYPALKYHDFSNLYIFSPDMYECADHLNAKGAHFFTVYLDANYMNW